MTPPAIRVVFPAASERGQRGRERELVAYAESLLPRMREALGDHRDDATVTLSWRGITELADECVNRLATGRLDPAGVQSIQLYELVLDLYELGLELCQHEVARRERRLGDGAAGLRRLRTLPSSSNLLDQVCEELVGKCGFGRAGLSWVESGFWRPATGHLSTGDEFSSWFGDWVDQPIPISESTAETMVMTDRTPAAVFDTSTSLVHRPITIETGQALSYVVAPVMRGNEVIAFLHADHFPSARHVDSFDLDVLGAFADGFSLLFEQVLLSERLRTQRDQVWEIVSGAVKSMDDLCDPGIDLMPGAPPGAIVRDRGRAPVGPTNDLTAREAEVFALLTAGATNKAIAEKLVVTEDTVKSHVKHILRKLGVANRSQAIASALNGVRPDPRA